MLKWNSVPGNVLELTFAGTIVPLLNRDIVQEHRTVLSRPKFHLTKDIITDVVGELERLGLYIDVESLDIVLPDRDEQNVSVITSEPSRRNDR